MSVPPRTPPRFVPTLTDVVHPGDAVVVSHAPVVPAPPWRTTVMPPHEAEFPSLPVEWPHEVAVPSLMPASGIAGGHGAGGSVPWATSPAPSPATLPEGLEEFMVHRVMQRVDVVLDQRLREAIATVVQEQTRSVLPRLREEIESVVRHAVYEAVADELASGTRPAHQS
jgi:hypothetical protein